MVTRQKLDAQRNLDPTLAENIKQLQGKQTNEAHNTTVTTVPKNDKAALSIPQWHAAMLEELQALSNNRTWTWVPRPPDTNIIGPSGFFESNIRMMAPSKDTRHDSWPKDILRLKA